MADLSYGGGPTLRGNDKISGHVRQRHDNRGPGRKTLPVSNYTDMIADMNIPQFYWKIYLVESGRMDIWIQHRLGVSRDDDWNMSEITLNEADTIRWLLEEYGEVNPNMIIFPFMQQKLFNFVRHGI